MSALLAGAAGALAGAALMSLLADVAGALRSRSDGRAALVPVFTRVPRDLAARLPQRVARSASADAGDVAARLDAAGIRSRIGASEWAGVKLCAAASGGLLATALGGELPGRLHLVAIAAAPVAGFVAPEFWLGRRTARRLREASDELAPMIDLLQVAVQAGAAPAPALGMVGARFRGPLAGEWRAAATAIALGTPQDQALAAMARRLPSPRVQSLAETLRRARRRGLPLADLLAAQAAAARHERQVHVRERAARAGPKIQLVVAFVLVPSVMLIVAAALIAELTAPGLSLTY